MSYIRYTQALVVKGSSRRRDDGQVTISPGETPTLGELQGRIGGEISHGFEVIGNNGRVLAAQTGFSSEGMAKKGVRELRRALLPGVRQDVKALAEAWQDGYNWGVTDEDTARGVGDPAWTPNRVNPYREEIKEADRAGN